MRQVIERFLTSLRAQNMSPNTLRAYSFDLAELVRFVGPEQTPDQISRTVVRGFLAFVSKNGAGKKTVLRKLAVVKSFTRWMAAEGVLPYDISEGISGIIGPKLSNVLPDIPSQEEVALLLDGDFPTSFPERDRLILELTYGTGLRVSEVANISLDDIRPEQRSILIHGKGGKERLAPLNPYSTRALAAYLPVRAKLAQRAKLKDRAVSALFFGLRGEGKNQDSISVRTVRRILFKLTTARGLPPLNPHALRHACATHMLDNGCPLDVISQILGHSNLDTTAHYAQVSTRLMMSTYSAAHPHAR